VVTGATRGAEVTTGAGRATGAPKELTMVDFICSGVTLTVAAVVTATGAAVTTGAAVVTGAGAAVVTTGANVVTGAGAAAVDDATVAVTAAGKTTAFAEAAVTPLLRADSVTGFSVKISTNLTSSGFSSGRGFLPGCTNFLSGLKKVLENLPSLRVGVAACTLASG